MATHGDTLSTVLLVVAIGALGSAALGTFALGALEVSRRWRASLARGESPTFRFRMPVAGDATDPEVLEAEPSNELDESPLPEVLDADFTTPSPLVDPTDRFNHQPLFEAQTAANDDPFEGDDTTPFLDLEPPGGISRAAGI
jgi:hypothetical protein